MIRPRETTQRGVKRFANQLTSMREGSKHHIMEMALEKQLQNIAAHTIGRGGLEKPPLAAQALRDILYNFSIS